jgi:thioredoxin-like negative regulator of GroEL
MIAPHFEMLAKQHNGYFVKVDVDECDEVAQQLSIRSMPTFVAFKDGKEIERFSGANQGKLGYLVSRLCPRIVAAADVAAADKK